MNQALVSLALIAGAMTVYLIVHLVLFRAFLPVERWIVLKRMYAIALPLITIAARSSSACSARDSDFFRGSDWTYLLCALMFLWLLHNAYLMFYAFIDRSISIRTNVEAHLAGTPVTFEELRRRYDTVQSYHRRLEILREAGYLEKDGERYRITPRGASLARGVRWLKQLYRLGLGG